MDDAQRSEAARELVIRSTQEVAIGPVKLDEYATLLANIATALDAAKHWKARADQLKEQLATILGSAEVGTVNGEEAVTFRPSADFSEGKFKAKYPDLYRAYVITRTVEQIDLVALKRTRPELYEEFRTRPMRVTWKPPGSNIPG